MLNKSWKKFIHKAYFVFNPWKLELTDIIIFDLFIQMNVYIINYIRLYH